MAISSSNKNEDLLEFLEDKYKESKKAQTVQVSTKESNIPAVKETKTELKSIIEKRNKTKKYKKEDKEKCREIIFVPSAYVNTGKIKRKRLKNSAIQQSSTLPKTWQQGNSPVRKSLYNSLHNKSLQNPWLNKNEYQNKLQPLQTESSASHIRRAIIRTSHPSPLATNYPYKQKRKDLSMSLCASTKASQRAVRNGDTVPRAKRLLNGKQRKHSPRQHSSTQPKKQPSKANKTFCCSPKMAKILSLYGPKNAQPIAIPSRSLSKRRTSQV